MQVMPMISAKEKTVVSERVVAKFLTDYIQ